MKVSKLSGFADWLQEQGAVILPAAKKTEFIRFRAHNTVHTIMLKSSGHIDAKNFAHQAVTCFMKGMNIYMGVPKIKLMSARRAEILARDGNRCFYCMKVMAPNEITLEHLVSKASGGPDHPDNLALAHRTCNSKAANKPLFEKINIHLNAKIKLGLIEIPGVQLASPAAMAIANHPETMQPEMAASPTRHRLPAGAIHKSEMKA